MSSKFMTDDYGILWICFLKCFHTVFMQYVGKLANQRCRQYLNFNSLWVPLLHACKKLELLWTLYRDIIAYRSEIAYNLPPKCNT